MQQKVSTLLSSKPKTIGFFATICLLLTIPLSLLLVQQEEDIRGKAAEPTPTITPLSQGTGFIAGYVFYDTNKNGERESGEKPFTDSKIKITQIRNHATNEEKSDETISEITTDANGYFKFRFSNLLPDSLTYFVKVVLPDGYKTINTNPVRFSELKQHSKELVEFGLFPLSEPVGISVTQTETASATPSPAVNCVVRPACLDAVPSCNLPEPAQGWCPK